MKASHHLRHAVLACLFGLSFVSAACRAEGAALQWHCWVDAGERLQCVLESVNQAALAPAAGTGSTINAAVRTPAGARSLPPIVAQIRTRPHTLTGQIISIPLFTITDDWPRVRQLAEAVLCTASPSCSIRLSSSLRDALARGLDTDRLFAGPDIGMADPALTNN